MKNVEIGLKIKYYREQNEITQKKLADHLGISRTALSHYESGDRLPNIFVIWKIADYFHITIDELVGRKNK